MYICIHMYICTHTYVHIYICIYIYTHTYMNIYIIHVYTYIYIYIIYTYIHTMHHPTNLDSKTKFPVNPHCQSPSSGAPSYFRPVIFYIPSLAHHISYHCGPILNVTKKNIFRQSSGFLDTV